MYLLLEILFKHQMFFVERFNHQTMMANVAIIKG